MAKTHGKSSAREYKTWANMIGRCKYEYRNDFKYYGGKGVTVCDEWSSFETFHKDMGNAPTNKHTLDRINGSQGYNKENCRWATMKEQNRNRQSTRFDFVDGFQMTKKEISLHLGITRKTLDKYYARGFNAQDISAMFSKDDAGYRYKSATKRVHPMKRPTVETSSGILSFNDKYEAAEYFGIAPNSIAIYCSSRISNSKGKFSFAA